MLTKSTLLLLPAPASSGPNSAEAPVQPWVKSKKKLKKLRVFYPPVIMPDCGQGYIKAKKHNLL